MNPEIDASIRAAVLESEDLNVVTAAHQVNVDLASGPG